MAEQRKESLIDLVAFTKDVAGEPSSTLKRILPGDPDPSRNAGGLRL